MKDFTIRDDSGILYKGTLGKMLQHYHIMQAGLGEAGDVETITGKPLKSLPAAVRNWKGDLTLYGKELLLAKATKDDQFYYQYPDSKRPGIESHQPPEDLWRSLEKQFKKSRGLSM